MLRQSSTNYETCFVGHCLSNRSEVIEYGKLTGNQKINRCFSVAQFKPDFNIREVGFWTMIQEFHDWDYLWLPNKSKSTPDYCYDLFDLQTLPSPQEFPKVGVPDFVLSKSGLKYYDVCRYRINRGESQASLRLKQDIAKIARKLK